MTNLYIYLTDLIWWLVKSNRLTSYFLLKFGRFFFPVNKDNIVSGPIMDKSDLSKRMHEFKSLFSVKGYSSGTTNNPVTVFRTFKSIMLEEYVVKSYIYQATGLLNPRTAVIRGHLIQTKQQKYWLRMPFSGRLIMSSFHISQSTFLNYLNQLNIFKPDIIMAYPSSLATLAKFAGTVGWRPDWPLRGVFASSETWNDADRELCERVFGAIFDQYGQAERVAMLQQCKHKNYHVRHDYSFVEFIKEGELFRIVGTNRHNSAMPLLRYDTGDYVSQVVFDFPCPCGVTSDCAGKIIGRQDDILYLKDGRSIGRLDVVFKKITNLLACQIVQNSAGDIQLNIVPIHEEFSHKLLSDIKKSFEDHVGQHNYVEYQIVKEVPRTRNGKFKSVVSDFRVEPDAQKNH